MIRRICLTLLLALSVVGVPAAASATHALPTSIPLPNGFRPEGIAIGEAPVAYLGSLADGSIFRADLITGRGEIISQGPGTPSVGLKLDRGRLFVSGGAAGNGRVVDAQSGVVLASYQFATGTTFINDVIVTGASAWFTDSMNPVLYRVPRFGTGAAVAVPLTGDIVFQPGFNTNGISRTPDGRGLIIVQTNTGKLFRVEPNTGVTHEIALSEPMTNGDGILLDGRTLYVVQNQRNTVAVLRLARSSDEATVVAKLTDERFDVPTTVAKFRDRLYLPNARFNTPPEPTTEYQVLAIPNR